MSPLQERLTENPAGNFPEVFSAATFYWMTAIESTRWGQTALDYAVVVSIYQGCRKTYCVCYEWNWGEMTVAQWTNRTVSPRKRLQHRRKVIVFRSGKPVKLQHVTIPGVLAMLVAARFDKIYQGLPKNIVQWFNHEHDVEIRRRAKLKADRRKSEIAGCPANQDVVFSISRNL